MHFTISCHLVLVGHGREITFACLHVGAEIKSVLNQIYELLLFFPSHKFWNENCCLKNHLKNAKCSMRTSEILLSSLSLISWEDHNHALHLLFVEHDLLHRLFTQFDHNLLYLVLDLLQLTVKFSSWDLFQPLEQR